MTARVLEMLSLFLRKSLEEGLDSEDRRDMVESLVEQGHNPSEVHAALNIFEHLEKHLEAPTSSVPVTRTNRLFILLEELQIPPEIRGYLTQLVSYGVLNPVQREELVERLMLMDPDDLTLDEVESLLEEMLVEESRGLGHFDETVSDYYH